MALPSNALTTVAAVCAELSLAVPTGGSAAEADLEQRIAAASDAVEKFCGRSFRLVEDVAEKVAGWGGECLFLSRSPIVSVSAVTYLGDDVDPEEWESTPDERDAAAGILRNLLGCWEETKRRDYSVTYSAGYVLPKDATGDTPRTLPYDVERACILAVVADYKTKGRDETVLSESVSGGNSSASVSYAGSTVSSGIGRGTGGLIPDKAVAILRPYQRVA